MNQVTLKGYLKDIKHSHTIEDINFSKARMLVQRNNGKEDVIDIKFKSLSNHYKENDLVCLTGNVRSYSHKVSETKNCVEVYVFTYFDRPDDEEVVNEVQIDGRICKIEKLRQTKTGKHNIHFILANNITSKSGDKRLNAYIPCIAWGNLAQKISQLSVSTPLKITGELRSREHRVAKDDGSYDIQIAHEVYVCSYEVVK